MPKIAEMKIIDNELWVRVGAEYQETTISLYTAVEVENLKRDTALGICELIRMNYPKHHEGAI